MVVGGSYRVVTKQVAAAQSEECLSILRSATASAPSTWNKVFGKCRWTRRARRIPPWPFRRGCFRGLARRRDQMEPPIPGFEPSLMVCGDDIGIKRCTS